MTQRPVQIRGVAHPPPPRDGSRRNPADLNRAEIAATNIAGRPLLNEHDSDARVGTCLASWAGNDGSLRIAANVEDPSAIKQLKNGTLRGLSLGTDMVMDEGGDVLFRNQAELSMCAEGKRPGTWIDYIDGHIVHQVACASKTRERVPHPRYRFFHNTQRNAQSSELETLPTMTDSEPVPMQAESARDELVERLKKELAEKTEAEARANARAGIFEEKERSRVAAFQPEAQFFMKEFLKEEIEAHHKDSSFMTDVAPLGVWSDEFTAKKDITSQGALAACSYIASKGIKRLREQASVGATATETLSNTMKENEQLKQDKNKLQRDYDECMELANERQKGLEVLQSKLLEAGLMNEKFDFSKLTSREQEPPAAALEPHQTAAATPALETVKAEASKAAQSRAGNPLERSGDLLTSLLSRSSGGLRMTASGTAHSLLGAQEGAGTDIAAIMRATAMGV